MRTPIWKYDFIRITFRAPFSKSAFVIDCFCHFSIFFLDGSTAANYTDKISEKALLKMTDMWDMTV